jgi:hypothetical protein
LERLKRQSKPLKHIGKKQSNYTESLHEHDYKSTVGGYH